MIYFNDDSFSNDHITYFFDQVIGAGDSILNIKNSLGFYDFGLECSIWESIKGMPIWDIPEILAKSPN